MTRRSRLILRHEMLGAMLIVVTGSLLHFVFNWAGGWPPLALIAAVNESIWEHLKLAFWPGLAWACLPLTAAGIGLRIRLAARGYSLLLTATTIVVVFQTYTHILGDNVLVLDIGTFVLAVILGQTLAATLLIRAASSCAVRRLGLALLSLQLLAYALFTYLPPDHWLFIDGRNGLRGILPA